MIPKRKNIGELSSVKSKKSLFSISLLFVSLILFFTWYQASLQSKIPGSKEQKIFVIPKGQTTNEIVGRLEKDEFIRSATALKIYLYLNKDKNVLQAGSFRLNPAMTAPQILKELEHGTLDLWATIPEGWRAEQIADEFIKQGFWKEQPKTQIYSEFKKHEGKLFPDTYLFDPNSNIEAAIQKMTDNFRLKTEDLKFSDSDLILASLIEREAKHDQDRPLIASILKNRLKINMALQIDATLQYVMDSKRPIGAQWWQMVAIADKKVKSPYNTYLNTGLPPTPICNPGLSSIKAALNPAKTDYFYYLSESDGTTHYAATLSEHNENIKKYLK